MILNDYNQLIREHFDLSDTKTRKFIVTLEEADQSQVLTALASALYDKIVEKVDKVDFGTIPRSRGDITKVDGYENTVECLNIIRKLVIEYREDTKIVDTVIAALYNVKDRKGMFVKAFAMNIELPMLFYNLIVMSIEQSVSFLISVCIEYIKDPNSENMVAAFDKVSYNNAESNLLYEQLVSFNNSCANKEFDSAMDQLIKNFGKVSESGNEDCGAGVNSIIINVGGREVEVENPKHKGDKGKEGCSPFKKFDKGEEDCEGGECEKDKEVAIADDCISGNCALPVEPGPFDEPVSEIGVSGGIALGIAAIPVVVGGLGYLGKGLSFGLNQMRTLIGEVIPTMRKIVYYFIHSVVKFSDCLAIQAQLIEINAYSLQYSTTSDLDDTKKAKVIKKQLKIAQFLKNWSNKLAIDDKRSKKSALDMVKDDTKKLSVNDLKGQLPDDIYADLF